MRNRICFCVPMARPVFEPHIEQSFGGSEMRAYWFATGLASHGWGVEARVDTNRQASPTTIQGVELRYRRLPKPLTRWRDEPSYGRRLAGWPEALLRRSYRSVIKRWFPAWAPSPENWARDLSDSNAEWFACFGVHAHAAAVINQADRMGRHSVLFLASDTDLSEAYKLAAPNGRNAYGQSSERCLYCLQHASVIVAQTQFQRETLLSRFGRQSTLIRNPIGRVPTVDPPLELLQHATDLHGKSIDVLWVGRADCFSKRADLALRLMRQCPTLRFMMVMNRRDPRVYRQLIDDVPPNVRVVQFVPWRQMDHYFRASHVLLNTSDQEGFPNAFLQAATHGVAVMSLHVDPDGMLSKHGCGYCARGDFGALQKQLNSTADLSRFMARSKTAGPAYVGEYHELGARCRELTDLLGRVPVDAVSTAGIGRSSLRSIA